MRLGSHNPPKMSGKNVSRFGGLPTLSQLTAAITASGSGQKSVLLFRERHYA